MRMPNTVRCLSLSTKPGTPADPLDVWVAAGVALARGPGHAGRLQPMRQGRGQSDHSAEGERLVQRWLPSVALAGGVHSRCAWGHMLQRGPLSPSCLEWRGPFRWYPLHLQGCFTAPQAEGPVGSCERAWLQHV